LIEIQKPYFSVWGEKKGAFILMGHSIPKKQYLPPRELKGTKIGSVMYQKDRRDPICRQGRNMKKKKFIDEEMEEGV
jgi:hypothetical protein